MLDQREITVAGHGAQTALPGAGKACTELVGPSAAALLHAHAASLKLAALGAALIVLDHHPALRLPDRRTKERKKEEKVRKKAYLAPRNEKFFFFPQSPSIL